MSSIFQCLAEVVSGASMIYIQLSEYLILEKKHVHLLGNHLQTLSLAATSSFHCRTFPLIDPFLFSLFATR